MSDDQNAGPLEWRQRITNTFQAMEKHLDGRQAQIHTSMPGHIISFDPKTMTVKVQPAIQAMHKQTDGTIKPTDITPITDVPVHFPAGGGYTHTFPIKPGDECMVVFHERSIDNWHQHGGTQTPSDFRKHDINDASVHVGLRSQPNILNPAVHAENAQFRSDDGKRYVEIDNSGDMIRIIVGQTEVTVDNAKGTITLKAPTKVMIEAPEVEVKSPNFHSGA